MRWGAGRGKLLRSKDPELGGSMIEHQIETTLRQRPEEAFDFFVDFRNEPAWNPDCLIVEKTSEGPIAVGTTFTGKMKRIGPSESEIVALERPTRCSVVDRSRGGEGTFDFRFTPSDGGTHVAVVMRMQPRGPMRLLQPLMGRMIRSMLADLPEKMRHGIDAADRVREHVASGDPK
jgi:hypothetical protein